MSFKSLLMPCGLAVIIFIFASPGNAQDAESDIEKLRKAAQAEVESESAAERKEEETSFASGALGLQELNPEISVTGDFLWSGSDAASNGKDSDFNFRGLGIHVESYLDPYTKFKAAVPVNEDTAKLGEAYMTRFGILPQVNLTLGKFRQQFGVVNRWHKHSLDQVDFPMALKRIFGVGGLNSTGLSLDWTAPSIQGFAQGLTVQLTDADNDRLFSENTDNNPGSLLHYKLYRDLSASTYAELGATALYGQNNEWQVGDAMKNEDLDTFVYGIDFTMLWEPTDRMRYRNITWRSEAYILDKDILGPTGIGKDTLNAWGCYSYVESKVSRTWIFGVRGDYFAPDSKEYADYSLSENKKLSLAPLAVPEDDPYQWQVAPYITWHQSPFVHFRIEYRHQDDNGSMPSEDSVWLQCIFAAGPHKHERY